MDAGSMNSEILPCFPTPPPDAELLVLLKKAFKLNEFRPSQLKAIRSVVSGRDSFVRMATGSGKSLVWQVSTVSLCDNEQFKFIVQSTHSYLL